MPKKNKYAAVLDDSNFEDSKPATATSYSAVLDDSNFEDVKKKDLPISSGTVNGYTTPALTTSNPQPSVTPDAAQSDDPVKGALTQIPADKREWALAQLRFETGDQNLESNVSRLNNNFSGITWNKNFPDEWKGSARPDSEGGNYVHFPTANDWANEHLKILKKDSGSGAPIDAKSIEDFAHRLKQNGYYTADEKAYVAGLKRMYEKYGGDAPQDVPNTPTPNTTQPAPAEPTSTWQQALSPKVVIDNDPVKEQAATNRLFGVDATGAPIINTARHTKPTPQQLNERYNQSASHLAGQVVEGMQENPQTFNAYHEIAATTPLNVPGNPVHDISDLHGDPEMTGGFYQHRIAALEQQRLQQVTQLGYNATPDNVDKVNADYAKKIDDLKASTKDVTALQLFNKEITQKALTKTEADIQLNEIQKAHEKEVEAVNNQFKEDTNPSQNKRGKYAASVGIAEKERDQKLHEIAQKYNEQAGKVKAQERWDGVRLGIEQQRLLGDKQAEADAAAYDAGRPISPAANYHYQTIGKEIMEAGTAAAEANGQNHVVETAKPHIDTPEKIEKDNKPFLKGVRAQAIGNAAMKEESDWYHAVFPHFGSMTNADKLRLGRAQGLPDDQINEIDNKDIPTSATLWQQGLSGAFNAPAPLYERGVRTLAALAGANPDAVNARFHQGWENEQGSGLGAAIQGNIPSDQNTFTSVRNVLGQMASTIGNLSVFAGEVGGVSKGLEGLGVAATKADKYANFAVMGLQGYNDGYHKSLEVIGDKPEDEWKRQILALTDGLTTGAIFSISPKANLVKNALGLETKSGEQFLKELNAAKGIESLEELKPSMATYIHEISKELGTQVTLATAQKMSENIMNKIANPKREQSIDEDLGTTAATTAITMLLPSIMGGVGHVQAQTPLNKATMFEVGSNPKPYIDDLNSRLAAGKITPQEAAQSHDAILQMKTIVDQTPTMANGKPLTPDQIKDYSWNLMQRNILTDRLKKIEAQGEAIGGPDEAQIEPIKKQINDLKAERTKIFKEAGTSRLPVPEKPEEKLAETKENVIPLTPQEVVTTKTNDNGREIQNEEGRQSSANEDNVRSETERTDDSETGHEAGQDRELTEQTAEEEIKAAPQERPKNVKEVTTKIKERTSKRKVNDVVIQPSTDIAALEDGNAAGKPTDEVQPLVDAAIKENPDQPVDANLPGKPQGESFNDLKDRVKKGWENIVAKAKDNTLLVTHSSVIKLIKHAEKDGWDAENLNETYANDKSEPEAITKLTKDSKTIWLARHGETVDTEAGNNRTKDTELTDKGRQEAKDIAVKELNKKGIVPSDIITSDLPRAQETADIIAENLTPKQTEHATPQSKEQQQESRTEGSVSEHAPVEQTGRETEKPSAESRNKPVSGSAKAKEKVTTGISLGGKLKLAIPEDKLQGVQLMNVADLHKMRTPAGPRHESVADMGIAGIREPLEVIRFKDGTYQLQNGNHRLDEAMRLGAEKLPVIIKDEKYSAVKKVSPQKADVYSLDGKKETPQITAKPKKVSVQAQKLADVLIGTYNGKQGGKWAPLESMYSQVRKRLADWNPKAKHTQAQIDKHEADRIFFDHTEKNPPKRSKINQAKRGTSSTADQAERAAVLDVVPHTIDEWAKQELLGIKEKEKKGETTHKDKFSLESVERHFATRKGTTERKYATPFVHKEGGRNLDQWANAIANDTATWPEGLNLSDPEAIKEAITPLLTNYKNKSDITFELARQFEHEGRLGTKSVDEHIAELERRHVEEMERQAEAGDDLSHSHQESEQYVPEQYLPEKYSELTPDEVKAHDVIDATNHELTDKDIEVIDKYLESVTKDGIIDESKIDPFDDKYQAALNHPEISDAAKKYLDFLLNPGKGEEVLKTVQNIKNERAKQREADTAAEGGEIEGADTKGESEPAVARTPDNAADEGTSEDIAVPKEIQDKIDKVKEKYPDAIPIVSHEATETFSIYGKDAEKVSKILGKTVEDGKITVAKSDLDGVLRKLVTAGEKAAIVEDTKPEKIKAGYKKKADAVRGLKKTLLGEGEKNTYLALGPISPKSIGKFIDKVADFIEKVGNLHVAVHRAIEWLKAEHPNEKVGLNDIAEIKDKIAPILDYQTKEPIFTGKYADENREIAETYQDWIDDGSATSRHPEAVAEVMENEDLTDQERSEIINYLDWHTKDRKEFISETLRQPGNEKKYLAEYPLAKNDELSHYISGDTIENVFGDDVQFNKDAKEKTIIDNLVNDGANMIGLAKNHSATDDVTIYGPEMLGHINDLPQSTRDEAVKKLIAYTALHNELQAERLRMEKEPSTPEIKKRLADIKKLTAQTEIGYRDLTSAASDVMNAARANRIYRNTYFSELYADRILADKDRLAKEETEKMLTSTEIPDDIAKDKGKKEKDKAEQSTNDLTEAKNKSKVGKEVDADITGKEPKVKEPKAKEESLADKAKKVVEKVKEKMTGKDKDGREKKVTKDEAETKAKEALKGRSEKSLFEEAREKFKKPC